MTTAPQHQWEIAGSSGEDGLTGLPDRQYMMRRVEQALLDAEQTGMPVALFLADLDHFQPINEMYGHRAGDRILCEIARTMRAAVAPDVLLGRWGGGQFVGLLPIGDIAEVTTQAEAARVAVDELYSHSREKVELSEAYSRESYYGYGRGLPSFLTISVGVAASTPAAPMSATQLLTAADQGLWKAKQQSGNRVIAD